jgi:hypothetical protein
MYKNDIATDEGVAKSPPKVKTSTTAKPRTPAGVVHSATPVDCTSAMMLTPDPTLHTV